jgi:hypothetical protein
MTELAQRILDKVRGSLGADRLLGTIVYLDWNPIRAGERVQLGDALIEVPWDAHITFVDLEPKANWGHACCYLAIRRDGDEVIHVAAHMPPFLKAETSTFRLLWRGPLAPEWAVATNPD